MKKLAILAAALLMAGSANAQKVQRVQYQVSNFSREMPCKGPNGDVIATQVGTVCLPYAPTMVEGATLYELVSASATEWIFQTVSEPQANTPYVYRVENGAERVTFYGSGSYERQLEVRGAAAGHEGAFVGTYRSHVVTEPAYFLSGDRIQYTEQPINGSIFRCYFTPDVMPAGETLSPNVEMRFVTPAGLRELQEQRAQEGVTVDRHNIGLQQGEYQMGGKKVTVK